MERQTNMFPNETGLLNEDVLSRQKQFGPNILPEKPPPSSISLFFQQFKSPLVYVLLLAAAITVVIGHLSDALIILFAVVINTILGFIQESRSSKALTALKKYVTNMATVIRDGQRVEVEVSGIVPGDLVVLNQGVKIPADGRLTFANRLYINEAVLTGESMPVTKSVGDLVFMGTTISSGQAMMQVDTTGAHTKIGKIAEQIQTPEEDTPLQEQLKWFSKKLVIVIITLVAIVFVTGFFLHKLDVKDLFITSVALAVSSIPEGLLVSLTVILAIGMQKILKRKGLVRRLSAAETLGGVTVICIDKTGTLTEGKMEVAEHMGDKTKLAEQVLLANDLDDPIVISAFEWGRSIISNFVSEHPRLDSIPFSPNEKFFMSLNTWSDKSNIIFVNGAPELLLQWSTLPVKEQEEVVAAINNLTSRGKRIIGFARKEVSLEKKTLEVSDAKSNLEWCGFLAFSDPIRDSVKEALVQAKNAKVRTIVITGDYTKTSEFVLLELGIPVTKNETLTGEELSRLSKEELTEKVKTVTLFARTTPGQKLMIVEALKNNGEIVAMMGDGVNDAPALHKADIGIVVENASDVAKESADLILLDSNFSTIIGVIEEGRVMFENIRKVILYLLSDAFAEIIVVFGGITLGLPLPITVAQILWINLISDGLPNLTLTIDPKRAGIMNEKPRPTGERLVNTWMLTLIGLVSITAGLIAFASFVVVYKLTGDVVLARSMAFITLGLNSLAYVFSVRALMTPFWKNHLFENKWLVVAVILGIGFQLLPFATPTLRQFFGLRTLDTHYWLVAGGLSVLMFFIVEVFKFIYTIYHRRTT